MKLLEKFKSFELKNSERFKGGGVVTWVGSDGNGNNLWDGVSDNGQDESCNIVDKPGYDISVGDPFITGTSALTLNFISITFS